MTQKCGYNEIKPNSCNREPYQYFQGLFLCEEHYDAVIELYNHIVKTANEGQNHIIGPDGKTVYEINKDKLV